jgi:hypothetical protein
LSNNPKPLKKVKGAQDGNDEPKTIFKVTIEQLDNGTSRHGIPQGVPLEAVRNMLFTHMMLIQEQITMIHIEQKQQQVKILKPGQMPPGLKLHS